MQKVLKEGVPLQTNLRFTASEEAPRPTPLARHVAQTQGTTPPPILNQPCAAPSQAIPGQSQRIKPHPRHRLTCPSGRQHAQSGDGGPLALTGLNGSNMAPSGDGSALALSRLDCPDWG